MKDAQHEDSAVSDTISSHVVSVDRELQPVFQHEADTLHCARAYEIRFSTHVGADVNDSVLWDLPAFFDAGFVLAAATQ